MFIGLWLKGLALAAILISLGVGYTMIRNSGYRQCQVEYAERDNAALAAARKALNGPRNCRDARGVWDVTTATCNGGR